MCDYSEHGFPTRPAREGELLLTHRFPDRRIGFASAVDIETQHRCAAALHYHRGWWSALAFPVGSAPAPAPIAAISIPPGGQLRMSNIPSDLRRRFALRSVEDVWFIQNGRESDFDCDGIRFRSGRYALLQDLPEGIRFVLLSVGEERHALELAMPVWPQTIAA